MSNYLLKTVAKDGTTHGGFQWPPTAGVVVVASDWDPKPECGGGLHGLLNGAGNGSLLDWSDDAVWIVAEIDGPMVDLGRKIKCQQARTIVVGTRVEATEWLTGQGFSGVCGAVVSAGDGGSATTGHRGSAIAGRGGSAIAGDWGSAIAGDDGSSIAGDWGSSTAGDGGSAITGRGGSAITGRGGSAITGVWGSATAGAGGIISIRYWDNNRYRLCVGYIGEDGLLPGVAYRVERGAFVRVGDEA